MLLTNTVEHEPIKLSTIRNRRDSCHETTYLNNTHFTFVARRFRILRLRNWCVRVQCQRRLRHQSYLHRIHKRLHTKRLPRGSRMSGIRVRDVDLQNLPACSTGILRNNRRLRQRTRMHDALPHRMQRRRNCYAGSYLRSRRHNMRYKPRTAGANRADRRRM